jgi:hypothetical protein
VLAVALAQNASSTALGFTQRLFGLPAFGDVDAQPSDLPGALTSLHDRHEIAEPQRVAAFAADPVLQARVGAVGDRAANLGDRERAIGVGDVGSPRLVEPGRRPGAEQGVNPAGEERDAQGVGLGFPEDRVEALDQPVEALELADPPGAAERQRREVADAARQTQEASSKDAPSASATAISAPTPGSHCNGHTRMSPGPT